jgi:hypothetical protein
MSSGDAFRGASVNVMPSSVMGWSVGQSAAR